MEYRCECCHYSTDKRFNYDKHLLSKKHMVVDENGKRQPKVNEGSPQSQHQVAEKSANELSCKYCEQTFKFKQSMYRHMKNTCTKNNQKEEKAPDEDLMDMIQAMKLNIEQQSQEIKRQNERLDSYTRQLELMTMCIHSTLPGRNEPTYPGSGGDKK